MHRFVSEPLDSLYTNVRLLNRHNPKNLRSFSQVQLQEAFGLSLLERITNSAPRLTSIDIARKLKISILRNYPTYYCFNVLSPKPCYF